MRRYHTLKVVALMLVFIAPHQLFSATIENTVGVFSNSGGNSGASVETGESTAEVFIRTVINGEVFEKYQTDTSSVIVEETIISDDGNTSVEITSGI